MDFDFSTLLYILFAIIYFVFTSGKKKKKNQVPPKRNPANTTPPVQTQSQPKRPSFEELLEEFTGQKAVIQETKPAPIPEPKPVPVYEVPKKAPTLKEKSISTAYDNLKHRSISTQFGRFDEFEDEQETHEVLDDLQDPNTARKAFIYSEIFKRKY